MIRIRKSEQRGHFNHGWLESYHTFSFAEYRDERYTHFRKLRVINEDRVEPGQGFPTHAHRDMEIVTYVLEGALEHKDSMGNGSVLRRGDVQRMSAGTGVTHSEFNASRSESLHLLQIWIFPDAAGLEPGYEETHIDDMLRKNRLCLIASPRPEKPAVSIHQDVKICCALLDAGRTVDYNLEPGRHAWLQVAAGSVGLNGETLAAGDGAAVSDLTRLTLSALKDAEILLFDLA